MRNRKLVTLALSTAALAGAVLAAPAAGAADLTGNTTVTFAITGGTFSVATAATSASLASAGSLVGGTTVGGVLPAVTVTDQRAGIVAWSGNVQSAGFYSAGDAGKVIKIAPGQAKVFVPAPPSTLSGRLSPRPAPTSPRPPASR
jgi:hypothetical protein